MDNKPCEMRLTPKELSAEMERTYKILKTPRYFRALRAYSDARGEWLFVGGCAFAKDVFEWMATNKEFRRSMGEQRKAPMIGIM